MEKLALLIVVLVLVFNQRVSGQDSRTFKFAGKVTDKTDQKAIQDLNIDVYSGNKIIMSPEASKKGQFSVDLPGGGEYTIDINSNNYFPKRILVRTNIPEKVKRLPEFKFEVEMIRSSEYEELEKIDAFSTSVFDLPYVIFEYDEKLEDLHFREAYTKDIKKKYEEVEDLK